MPKTVVELLYFDGCPNHEAAAALLERVAAEEGVDLDLHHVCVASAAEADRLRFLGSPTVRVNGHDVEPGADQRTDFTFACRLYRTDSGQSGIPADTWLQAALRGA